MLVIPKKKRRTRNSAEHAPVVLEHLEDYLHVALRSIHRFADFSPALQQMLYSISFPATYRNGRILFAESEPARGVFFIEQGRVKLAAESSEGKPLILHIATSGEMVGLPATLSGRGYEVTAEPIETTQVRFVPRKPFLHWVQFNPEAGLRIAEILSDIYYATYRELRYLGLSTSAEARLARFLLAKISNHNSHNGHHEPAKINLTHQQIAAVIGLSRETVTRLLAHFKRKGFVTVRNAELLITSSEALRKVLGQM